MKNAAIKIFTWWLILLVGGCVDPYRPPEITSPGSYLVMNGFFNSAAGATSTIQLSRSQNLTDTKAPTVETKATVTIESQSKATFPLTEGTAGTYTLSGVTPQAGETYRLHVRTAKGVEYYSDYVPVIQTPPIDSVSWRIENNGVQINVNTHDPTNNTHYYRWEYDETWEYFTPYYSTLELKNNQIVDRPFSVNQCWRSGSSTNIMTTSTTRLSQDVVSQFPLVFVSSNSNKLSVKYSILVRQFALSQPGFDYYDQLAKITQNIGSIFDPQPSQITGNLHCTTNPNELALGFFRVGTVETKRIFITYTDVPFRTVTGYDGCVIDTFTQADIIKFQSTPIKKYGETSRYLVSSEFCVDCRLLGGVLTRPDFWK
ncbi:DUF4249 domain-containing protein [Spirosoma radiotolerans]|uniref:DUF4249 domain-containing protein n=1 Tax=Spirosoma radiotolerans TaxID=1379870 RepID=A0A0E3ZTU1_9BACT|nr:DUF4249 domain-containing protein [Spirosoma radiotolerans]AKD54769.1 hypothetical protein SD10_07470 [Spirosoma radiotolerans]